MTAKELRAIIRVAKWLVKLGKYPDVDTAMKSIIELMN